MEKWVCPYTKFEVSEKVKTWLNVNFSPGEYKDFRFSQCNVSGTKYKLLFNTRKKYKGSVVYQETSIAPFTFDHKGDIIEDYSDGRVALPNSK
jgi:hypothetical protein